MGMPRCLETLEKTTTAIGPVAQRAEEEEEGKTVETESGEEKTKQKAVFLHSHTVIEPEVGYRFGWISPRTPKLETRSRSRHSRNALDDRWNVWECKKEGKKN